jgi:hypothetical protein
MASIAQFAHALIALVAVPNQVGHAQGRLVQTVELTALPAALADEQPPTSAATTPAVSEGGQSGSQVKQTRKSPFSEDGPVDTAWDAQVESFWRALIRCRPLHC